MGEPEPAGRPRRRAGIAVKVVLGAALFGLVLLAAVAALVAPNLSDEPPFEDSDLLLPVPAVPAEEDAAPGIRRALELIDGAGLDLLDTIPAELGGGGFALRGEEGSGPPLAPPDPAVWEAFPGREAIEAALAADRGFFEAIDEACRKPRCSRPEWTDPHDVLGDWYESHSRCLGLLRLRSEAAFASGDRAATVEADLGLLRFAARRLEGARFLGEHAVAESLLEFSLFIIGVHRDAGIFAGSEERLAAELAAVRVGRGSVSQAIREEYRWQVALIRDSESYIAESLPRTVAKWAFQPNETMRILGEYYRAGIAEGEATGRVTVPPPDIGETAFGRIRRGNPIGRELIAPCLAVGLDTFYAGADQSRERLTRLRERVEPAAGDR